MDMEFKVLTLNCWGIPGVSANRGERIAAITTELASAAYDFVVLQEVWSETDYNLIARKTLGALPYSHYFHSGVIGAGLCIFSKAPIVDVLFQCWQLNGYAHKIQHGDWFGGKGVGLCKVLFHGLKINIYTSHLHAAYNRSHDEYLAHRLCQAFELSQFVKATGESSDVNILAGDLNSEPEDLVYKIICCNANLRDGFSECLKADNNDVGATNGHPRNTYTKQSSAAHCPSGNRIDFVLYNCNPGYSISCTSYATPLDKCPGQSLSFSDHEAVVATLQVTKSTSVSPAPLKFLTSEYKDVFQQVEDVLEAKLKKLAWDRLYYFFLSAALFCILLSTIYMDGNFYGFQILLEVLRIVLSLIMAFCMIMGLLWNRIERNGITNVQKVIRILLKPFRSDDIHVEKSPLLTPEVF